MWIVLWRLKILINSCSIKFWDDRGGKRGQMTKVLHGMKTSFMKIYFRWWEPLKNFERGHDKMWFAWWVSLIEVMTMTQVIGPREAAVRCSERVLSCLVKRKLVEEKKKGLRNIKVGELSQRHNCLGAVNVDVWRENHYCVSSCLMFCRWWDWHKALTSLPAWNIQAVDDL